MQKHENTLEFHSRLIEAAEGTFFQSFVPNAAAEKDDFGPYESKSVPQRTSVRLVYASVAISAVLSMVSEDSGVSTI